MADDVVGVVQIQVLTRQCANTSPHQRHRDLDGEFLTTLNEAHEGTIYECAGVSSEKLDQAITVTLTAAEVFIIQCALERTYSEAREHGTRWRRICGAIQLPTTGLTYKDVSGDD